MSSRARWPPALSGRWPYGLGVPAAGQLLDRRHVDRPVVQVVLDLGQVGGEEAAVGADRVAAQRHGARLGHVLLDEREGLRAGVLERDGRRLDRLEQAAAACASRARRRPCRRAPRRRLVHDEVGALGHDLQLVVGDERGDLDDDVAAGSSPVISRSIHTSTARIRTSSDAVLDGARASASIPTCRCPRTPTPGDAGADLVAARGRHARARRRAGPGPHRHRARHPRGLRRLRAAPQRPRPPPRRHVPQHAGPHRQRLPRRAARCCSSTPTRRAATRCTRGDRIAQLVIQRVEQATFDAGRRAARRPSAAPAASGTRGGSRVPELPEVEALARFLGEQARRPRRSTKVDVARHRRAQDVRPAGRRARRPHGHAAPTGAASTSSSTRRATLWLVHPPRARRLDQVVDDVRADSRSSRARRRWRCGCVLDDGAGFDVTETGTEKRLAVWVVRDPNDIEYVATLGPDPLDRRSTSTRSATLLAGGGQSQIKRRAHRPAADRRRRQRLLRRRPARRQAVAVQARRTS